MATDLEQLSVTLGARIDDFKKGMQDAVREFDKDANAIEKRNHELTQNMSRSMNETASSAKLLTAALKTLISVATFEKLITGAIEANTQLAQLARTADLARVSTTKLQEIQFAAKTLGGADPGDVTKAAHDLTLQAYKETREGEGELTKFLEANNMKLTDRNGKAKDFNQLMTMAATLLQRAGSEAQAIDIGKLFHLSEDMVRALDKGPGAFQRMQAQAKSAGAVIDDEIIQKAKEFDAKWNDAWSKFPTYAKSAAVEAIASLTPLGTWLTNLFSSLPGMASAVKHAAGYGEQTVAEAQDVLNQTSKLSSGDPGAIREAQKRLVEAQVRDARKRLASGLVQFEAESVKDRGVLGSEQYGPNLPAINDPKRGKDAKAKTDELERAEKAMAKQTIALDAQAAALTKTGEQAAFLEAQTKLLETAEEAGIKVTADKKLEIDRLSEAYAKAVVHLKAMKLETDLAFEREQIGRTPDEQAIAARTRGLPADDAKRLGDQMRSIQNLTEGKEIAGSFVKGLVSDLENGVKAGQALENQLKRIAEKLADKAIDSLISGVFGGLTGKGGILGGLFGGGSVAAVAQAQGGWAGQGPMQMVPAAAFIGAQRFQEGGGIPAILHAGEIVLNRAQQKNVASSMSRGGPINLTHAPTINGTGLSAEQVFSVVQRSQKEFARQIGPILNEWQIRHG